MGVWNKKKDGKEIDWKEIAKDLRADFIPPSFVYRTRYYFK